MNKLLLLLAGLAVGVGVYFAFFYEPCKEPSELMIQMTQLGCAMNLITEDLRVEVCKSLGREENCEFAEEDRGAISKIINDKINKCAKEQLEEKNYCTDNIKDLQ